MAKEVWKAIPGYLGLYEVSSLGRVRMLAHWVRCGRGGSGCFLREAHIINARVSKKGVCPRRRVDLYLAGKAKTRLVAHLVAEAFLGKRPKGQHCCHENGNSLDDRFSNLRYDTVKGNQHDRFRHGTAIAGEGHRNSKLTLPQVLNIRALYQQGGWSYVRLASKYKVNWITIQDIIKGRTWPYSKSGKLLPPESREELACPGNNRTKQARTYKAFGKTLTLLEWEKETGIAFATIDARLKKGWDIATALTKPVRGRKA